MAEQLVGQMSPLRQIRQGAVDLLGGVLAEAMEANPPYQELGLTLYINESAGAEAVVLRASRAATADQAVAVAVRQQVLEGVAESAQVEVVPRPGRVETAE